MASPETNMPVTDAAQEGSGDTRVTPRFLHEHQRAFDMLSREFPAGTLRYDATVPLIYGGRPAVGLKEAADNSVAGSIAFTYSDASPRAVVCRVAINAGEDLMSYPVTLDSDLGYDRTQEWPRQFTAFEFRSSDVSDPQVYGITPEGEEVPMPPQFDPGEQGSESGHMYFFNAFKVALTTRLRTRKIGMLTDGRGQTRPLAPRATTVTQ